jgi:hypothetical protein
MKKGDLSVGFVWIGAAVMGILILIFFINFALKQGAVGEQRISATVLNDIASILSSFRTADEKFDVAELPEKMTLEFECIDDDNRNSLNSDGTRKYVGQLDKGIYLKAGDIKRKLGDDIIVFAPPKIENVDKLILWSRNWKVPFSVTNFIYVAEPGKAYAQPQGINFPDIIQSTGESGQSLPNDYSRDEGLGGIFAGDNFDCLKKLADEKLKLRIIELFQKYNSPSFHSLECPIQPIDINPQTAELPSAISRLVRLNLDLKQISCPTLY